MPTTAPSLPASEPTVGVDGRRQRRDRNRDAVVRALLQLYRSGNFDPSIDEIATRSGVSARSVFRYFDDVDDLANAAIDQQLLDVAHLFPVKVGHDADFAERVAAVVHQRSSLFEAIASVGQVSRLRAPFNKVVAARLAEGRAALRDQLAGLFARELRAFPAAVRAQRLAAADVLAGFEGWHLLRTDQGLTVADAEAVLADSLARLLEG